MRNAWKTAAVAAVVATGLTGAVAAATAGSTALFGWTSSASAQVQSDDSRILLTQISLELTLVRSLLQKQLECQQCIAPPLE